MMFRFPRLILIVLLWSAMSVERTFAAHLDWDSNTLILIQRGGGYARMTRTTAGLVCCFEHRGACWVRHSTDEGKTWQEAVRVVGYDFGYAANPELLACRDGRLLLFYNGRPRDAEHPFMIGMASSNNQGATWTADPKPIYAAANGANNGCYEPAAIQLSSEEIDLFFANEFPYRDGQQEISLTRSTTGGRVWSMPQAVAFRRHCRDGMPVPIILRDGRGVAMAIEDNGLTSDHQLKPTIIHDPGNDGPVGGGSPQRWGAVDAGWKNGTYAGAPYLRQLFTGETILSCQSDQTRGQPRMVVYVGDRDAKHFADPTEPFTLDANAKGMWNSLFVKDRNTVTALSITKINGIAGVWAIDGHLQNETIAKPNP